MLHTQPPHPQVIDMQLPGASRVLGAALLQAPCQPAGGACGGGAVTLLLLTESELVALKLA